MWILIHQCTFCDDQLFKEGTEVFDNLENLEPSLSNQKKKKNWLLCI